MQSEKTDYCPHCRVVVAPGDPERVSNKHGVFHKGCWRQVENIRKSIITPVVIGEPINWKVM